METVGITGHMVRVHCDGAHHTLLIEEWLFSSWKNNESNEASRKMLGLFEQ